MGMLAGKRYIFFGDQKQLPPVLTRRYSGGAFRESIFEALAGRGFDTLLTETYRLNDALAAWPSAQFYAGRLHPAEHVAGQRIVYPNPPERLTLVLDPAQCKVFIDLQHRNATTHNLKEAGAVVDVLLALLESGLPPWEVAVVVPYRAQSRQIRALLRTALPDVEMRGQIVVDTVERMQGQEREAVIVSLTTSNPTFAAHLAEFFFQPERLNVAITRPRTKLIIVGSRHVLNAAPEDPDQQAAVALFRDLLATCAYHTLEPSG
jgi:DNA replication ATP-dependent helicase Dna2